MKLSVFYVASRIKTMVGFIQSGFISGDQTKVVFILYRGDLILESREVRWPRLRVLQMSIHVFVCTCCVELKS